VRVLLADPSSATRRRLGRTLRAAGHERADAGGAAQALALCRDWRPDVLVIASALIERDGIPVVDLVKADPEVFGIAVLQTVPSADAVGRGERSAAGEAPGLDRKAAGRGSALPLEAAMELLRRGTLDFLFEPVRDAELLARVQTAGRMKQLQEELVAQARRLENQLFSDPLTCVFNRRFLFSQLDALVSGARRHDRPIAVAVIDLDAFKAVNDRHGHAVGDRVLVASAEALAQELRAEDVLGRLGGEEFLVVLPDSDEDAAASTAERLRSAVATADGPVPVTASVGWAVRADGEGPEDLVRRADEALYKAKAAGRDRVRGGQEPSASLRRRS